jgi:hypothetical protein
MLPFLCDGDVALVVPAAGTEISVGDVVCYETSPGRFFMHRVIERTRDRFVAKGDASRSPTSSVRRGLLAKSSLSSGAIASSGSIHGSADGATVQSPGCLLSFRSPGPSPSW